MSDRDVLLQTVARANPVPASAPLPEDLAESRPPLAVLIEERSERFDHEPGSRARPTRWFRWSPVVVVAVALVLALLVAAPLLFLGGAEDETPVATMPPAKSAAPTTVETTAPSSTEVPSTTAEPTATAPAFPPALEMTWQRVSSPVFDGGWIAAIAEGGPGLVAVGGAHGPDPALSLSAWAIYGAGVWVSADGIEWARIDDLSFQGGESGLARANVYMADLAVGPSGRIVAVGEADERATVWWSDDGEAWTRVRHEDGVFGSDTSRIRHVLAAPFGFVALGEIGAERLDPQIVSWVSTDGEVWMRAGVLGGPEVFASDNLGFGGARLDAVTWNDMVIVVGSADLDQPDTWRPAVWVTSDGADWQMVPDDGIGAIDIQDDAEGMAMVSVAATGDGLVALGWSGDLGNADQEAVFWTSEDGLTWSLHPVAIAPASEAGQSFSGFGPPMSNEGLWGSTAMVGDGDRTIFSVQGNTDGIVFGSVDDGSWWYPIGAVDGGMGSEILSTWADEPYWTINDLVNIGDSLVAAGRTLTFSSGDDIGGRCYWDESAGWCRTDAAIWIGQWSGE